MVITLVKNRFMNILLINYRILLYQICYQVQQLKESMQEVLRCVSPSVGGSSMATQTEIIAVHTPQEDAHFPYLKLPVSQCCGGGRPSTLPLPPPQLTQYADCLVDGVLKTTVAEQHQTSEQEMNAT